MRYKSLNIIKRKDDRLDLSLERPDGTDVPAVFLNESPDGHNVDLIYNGSPAACLSLLRQACVLAAETWGKDAQTLPAVHASPTPDERNRFEYKDRVGHGGYDWTALYPQLMEQDEDELMLVIDREIDDGRTFSADAMENLSRTALSFVMARIQHFWSRTGRAPTKLEFGMKLGLDAQPENVVDQAARLDELVKAHARPDETREDTLARLAAKGIIVSKERTVVVGGDPEALEEVGLTVGDALTEEEMERRGLNLTDDERARLYDQPAPELTDDERAHLEANRPPTRWHVDTGIGEGPAAVDLRQR